MPTIEVGELQNNIPTLTPKKAKPAIKRKKQQESQDSMFIEFPEIKKKHEAPPDTDGTRIFYESLLRQKPRSLMAYKYCSEHGIIKN